MVSSPLPVGKQPRQALEHRRFTGTGLSYQTVDLAGLNVETDVIQHWLRFSPLAKREVEMLNFNHYPLLNPLTSWPDAAAPAVSGDDAAYPAAS